MNECKQKDALLYFLLLLLFRPLFFYVFEFACVAAAVAVVVCCLLQLQNTNTHKTRLNHLISTSSIICRPLAYARTSLSSRRLLLSLSLESTLEYSLSTPARLDTLYRRICMRMCERERLYSLHAFAHETCEARKQY